MAHHLGILESAPFSGWGLPGTRPGVRCALVNRPTSRWEYSLPFSSPFPRSINCSPSPSPSKTLLSQVKTRRRQEATRQRGLRNNALIGRHSDSFPASISGHCRTTSGRKFLEAVPHAGISSSNTTPTLLFLCHVSQAANNRLLSHSGPPPIVPQILANNSTPYDLPCPFISTSFKSLESFNSSCQEV